MRMVLLFIKFKFDKINIMKSAKVVNIMATPSFNKYITIKEPEAINKFINIISKDTSPMYIDKDKNIRKNYIKGRKTIKAIPIALANFLEMASKDKLQEVISIFVCNKDKDSENF